MHYENTSVLFMKAISLTPSISADSVDFLDSFNSKVKNVIDVIAPVETQEEDWQTKSTLEKMNSSTKYEMAMQKSWADVATARQTFSNLINSKVSLPIFEHRRESALSKLKLL